MSMEEEAARQAAANPQPPSTQGATAAPAVAATLDSGVAVQQPSGPTATSAVAASATTATDESDEALLQQALALSEGQGGAPDVEMTEEQDGDENLTEEEMIARAIEMSMHPEPESEEKKK
jgi:26S proteasome regulatory subunit N10